MWIKTERGWQRIVTNPFTLGSHTFANTPRADGLINGYHARTKEDQYVELASLVIPEKYLGSR